MPSLKARVNLMEANVNELSNKFSGILGELKAIKWIVGSASALTVLGNVFKHFFGG